MKKRRLIREVLQKIAPQIGATVILEPEWNIAGQIIFQNGKICYFKYSSLDLNSQGASEIAKDKDYANFFMKKMGYPAVNGKTFFSDLWCNLIGSDRNIDAAYKYAVNLGFPVVVKPNSGSQGIGVFEINSKDEFYDAARFIFEWDRVMLVQEKIINGNDYRVVVVDNKIISAYQRISLNIEGDGVSSILQLLEEKQAYFESSGRDTIIKIEDQRIKSKLKKQNLTLKSVPHAGEKIFLLDNANLSSGGDAIDVTCSLHPEFSEIAIQLTKEMGLRLCGVDFMVAGSIAEKPDKYWILEINASPGLDHYVKSGKEQEKVVDDMYLEILKSMERSIH
ncbi:hypothetical protein VU04_02155 [Desulfobulbus sp. TB]|nr:hypothetical protein [Desulfobulbus sp. TB]